MYITTVPNRNSRPAILLRESYREGGKVKNRTLLNLTDWPQERIEALRLAISGRKLAPVDELFDVTRSLPHGHVAAVLGTLRQLGLEAIIHSRKSRERDLVVAMVAARVLEPGSKLATARGLCADSLDCSLGQSLGVADADENELYAALDWLLERQGAIEQKLASRHLQEGSLVLYDLTSTWFEGRRCPLAQLGYSRDDKKGRLQVVFGLLCDVKGRPIATEVFQGNTADPSTLRVQIQKVRERFKLERVVFVGDRGMITQARIREELKAVEGLEWITSLRSPQVRALAQGGALQLSLFDQRDLAELQHPDYPGERLIACRNPLLAQERARKRSELLEATEQKLEQLHQATIREKRPLRGKENIGIRVGRILAQSKVGKHFTYSIAEDGFSYQRNSDSIAQESALDGIYIVRTSLKSEQLSAEDTVKSYKGLSVVERAFRCFKTTELRVRPIYHWNPDRVRAHIFLCMLAYYVEWHMRAALKPLLFADDDPAGAEAQRQSIVSPAEPSASAKRKAATKHNDAGQPVHSFKSLLAHMATLTKNTVENRTQDLRFERLSQPTPTQAQVFQLLQVDPARL